MTSKQDSAGSLQSLLGTVVIAVFVITFIVQAFQIPSESMENTLLIGDYLLVDKLRYGAGLPQALMPYRTIQRERYPRELRRWAASCGLRAEQVWTDEREYFAVLYLTAT